MPMRAPTFRPRYAQDPVQRRREAAKAHDKTRPNSTARGYDAEWRQFRAQIIAEQPFCVQCGSSERLNVDHIESVRAAPHRRLDPSNVRVLCQSCHSARTAREQAFGRDRP